MQREYVVQGNYGYGWDDLITEDDKERAHQALATYRENEPTARHRLQVRKVESDVPTKHK